jgi:acyl-CoA synthetase (AMP-forming)/AMP-acid ligase II
MVPWLNLGEMLKVNAAKYPDRIALCDRDTRLTYPQLNARVNKLANALLDTGLKKGDKVAALLENCLEIVEIYLACAKTGIIIVPINFRLAGHEVRYIVENSEASAMIVHDEFVPVVDEVKPLLGNVDKFFVVGSGPREGYESYEDFVKSHHDREPDIKMNPSDTWLLLYTSGTTGTPKGVIRSHESYVAFYLINAIDFGFTGNDVCMNVMPLCHVNSTFFSFTFTYIGGAIYVHPARGFKATEILEIIQREKITFISLIPTHYNLILSVPEEERAKYDVSSIRKLLCSSAPAHSKTKKGIMEYFKGVELYEGYGSTEAGIVTTLMPHEQMKKLGSIGRESLGTDFIKILDEDGNEAPQGKIGELYSRGPMLFDGYYKLPQKTEDAFAGEWFSAGDMARRDEDGYYYLVDRKHNLIITGGEHVYPSEVEEIISRHQDVFDAAVIGLPDEKWGEAVTAVVIPKDGREPKEAEIIDFCRDKMAAYKRPKKVIFIAVEEMPRTTTGKILHRHLRKRFGGKEEAF